METNESNFLGRVATHISTFVHACVRACSHASRPDDFNPFPRQNGKQWRGGKRNGNRGKGEKVDTRQKIFLSTRRKRIFFTSVFQDESLKKKKGSGRIKNELNVDVNDAARPPFRFIYRNICANLFVSRNEFHYEGTRELGMDLILLENGSTPR